MQIFESAPKVEGALNAEDAPNVEGALTVESTEYRSGFYREAGFHDAHSLPDYGAQSPVTREAFAYDFFPAATETSTAEASSPAPLLVWVHGGAWRFGTNRGLRDVEIMTPEGPRTNRQTLMRRALQEQGWAVASINYRYSHQALFPGALHDVKEAVRFFRANAHEFGIDPQRIAVAGGSAGGHLSMMVALAGPDATGYASGDPELHEYYEGRASSNYPGVSSAVAAAVPFYGVSDLRTIFSDRPLAGYSLVHPDDDGAEWRLLGCDYPVREEREWVERVPGIDRERALQNWERANPLDLARGNFAHRVYAGGSAGEPSRKNFDEKQTEEQATDRACAPIMLVHGIADSCVPYQQSVRVYQALRTRQVPTDMVLVPGAEHGDSRCFSPEIVQRMLSFLNATV
ncbi:MAG: alpha/beta hydrolase [Rothia mucilaginosa]|nr:alpha/beta hydrolase [Rothia mucilaginosa]